MKKTLRTMKKTANYDERRFLKMKIETKRNPNTRQIKFYLFFALCFFAWANSAFAQSGEISGNIERIKYKQSVNDNLRESKLENFDVNKSTGAFLLSNGKETIAVSRWISPKRTRSYPYERVYDTLAHAGKKVDDHSRRQR